MGDDVAIALTGGRAIPAAYFPVRDAGEPRPGILVIHELFGLAAEDAWRRTIEFFTRRLAPVPQ